MPYPVIPLVMLSAAVTRILLVRTRLVARLAVATANTVANNSSFASIPGGDSICATNYAFAAGAAPRRS